MWELIKMVFYSTIDILRISIVEVKLPDNRLWCQICRENNCIHGYYSIELPNIATVIDPERK